MRVVGRSAHFSPIISRAHIKTNIISIRVKNIGPRRASWITLSASLPDSYRNSDPMSHWPFTSVVHAELSVGKFKFAKASGRPESIFTSGGCSGFRR